MKTIATALLCLAFSPAAWAAGSTTQTINGTATLPGATGASPNAGEVGGSIGPYGYQPYTPNAVIDTLGAVPTIGPVAPVAPVENTPITTAPVGNSSGLSGAETAFQAQSVYSDCHPDDQGKSIKSLTAWECHAADGTMVSAGQCQTPAAAMPCN